MFESSVCPCRCSCCPSSVPPVNAWGHHSFGTTISFREVRFRVASDLVEHSDILSREFGVTRSDVHRTAYRLGIQHMLTEDFDLAFDVSPPDVRDVVAEFKDWLQLEKGYAVSSSRTFSSTVKGLLKSPDIQSHEHLSEWAEVAPYQSFRRKVVDYWLQFCQECSHAPTQGLSTGDG